jgi:hypothetical protein
MNTTIFSRKQLYDLVWSDSLLAISKKYNISDVGLRKACIRMNIPLPDAGHWNKVKAGQKVKIKLLPQSQNSDQEIRLSLRNEGQDVSNAGLSSQMSLQKEIEMDTSIDLNVKDTLLSPDPLVIKAEKGLSGWGKEKYYRQGDLLYAGKGNLNIRVSPQLLNRALGIMDTFIKTMRQRGHDFSVEERESYLLIAGEKLAMTLREKQAKSIAEDRLDSAESRAKAILVLEFKRYNASASCTDGKVLIEHQLSKLIAKLELLGERFKVDQVERRKWQDEFAEKQRIEKEIANRRQLELSSFKQMLKDSRRWKDAKLLREYINQIEQKATAEGKLTEDIIEWIQWARKKADWLDPLLNEADEWLAGVDPNGLFAQDNTNNLSSGYNQSYSQESVNKSSWPLVPWYLKKH